MSISYDRMRAALSRRIAGNPELVSTLAFALSVEGRAAGVPLRLLLNGPPGCGKTRLLHSILDVSPMPTILLSASDVCEPGFRGVDYGELGALVLAKAGGDAVRVRELGALILLDGVCRASRESDDSWATDVRRDRQEALASIARGDLCVVLRPDPPAQSETTGTTNWSVIGAGSFLGSTCRTEAPTDAELSRWGMVRSLIEAFPRRACMRPMLRSELSDVLRKAPAVAAALRAAEYLHAPVAVSNAAVDYLAASVSAGTVSMSRAVDQLVIAIERAAIREVERETPASDPFPPVVAPDDVAVVRGRAKV